MTTLIKNVQIIDGTGKPAYKGDIFIRQNKIVEIGDLGRQSAERMIQGAGLYASPGFINTASTSDHFLTLFSNSDQQDFLFEGVTTIMGGMCGVSLAPLLYGRLESVRKWADTNEINVDWHTFKEFLEVLGRRKLGVNFGTLIGHSTIRRSLIGETLRDLTEGELQVFEKMTSNSLAEGAFGLSTGLGYIHARGTPYYEIKRLLKMVKLKGGIYATHLRDEGEGLVASVKETARASREAGVTAIITHMQPILSHESEYRQALTLIETEKDADVFFTIFPFEQSHVPIYSFLPKWAQNGGFKIMLANLSNESTREKILKDLNLRHGEAIRITVAPGHEYMNGKLLLEFAAAREVNLWEGLLMLMELTRLRATLCYKNLNYPLVIKSLSHPRALIGSSSASFIPGTVNMEHKETFTKFLRLMIQNKSMPLEEAVRKITSLPAKIFNLENRGVLKSGAYADIALFSSDGLTGVDIKQVFVNGELAYTKEELQNSSNGMLLCRSIG